MEEKLEGGGHFRSFMKVLKSLYALLTLSAISICSASQCPIELSQFGTDVKGNVESFAKRFHNKPIYVAAKQDGSCELFFENNDCQIVVPTETYKYLTSMMKNPDCSKVVLDKSGKLFWHEEPIRIAPKSFTDCLEDTMQAQNMNVEQTVSQDASIAPGSFVYERIVSGEEVFLNSDSVFILPASEEDFPSLDFIVDNTSIGNVASVTTDGYSSIGVVDTENVTPVFGQPFPFAIEDCGSEPFIEEDLTAIKTLIKTGYTVDIVVEKETDVPLTINANETEKIDVYFFKGLISKN